MSLFEKVNRFLEDQLDNFLKENPLLEAKALLEQLKEQEKDLLKLIIQQQKEEENIQQNILSVAQDIQLWHSRVKKAQSRGEMELAQKAQERENSLLYQGNLLWGKMEGIKKQITQGKKLLKDIQEKQDQVKQKIQTQEVAKSTSANSTWNATSKWDYTKNYDPLDIKFREWETETELEEMKRNLEI